MGYKKLKDFKEILERDDFDYISDYSNIQEIQNIILYHLTSPDGKEENYINLLLAFVRNLGSFYEWIEGENIPDIKEGYLICEEILFKIKKLFKKPAIKRASISKGYLRKFNKIFLVGLSKLCKGLQAAFDPELLTKTAINKNQIARYLLDKKVGFGKDYSFNKASGRYSIGRHIYDPDFDKIYLVSTLRTIKRREFREKPKEFECWGHGNVRIHLVHGSFGRGKIYRVYKTDNVKEHRQHEADLRKRISDFRFAA